MIEVLIESVVTSLIVGFTLRVREIVTAVEHGGVLVQGFTSEDGQQ